MNAKEDTIEQLFIALTARWRKENGILAIGVTKSKLLKASKMNHSELSDLLNQLKEKIQALGLDLVEYLYEGETWYAIRSNYVCPGELKSDEEAVLAVVIHFVENNKKTSLEELKKKLVSSQYFKESKLDSIVHFLENSGYIQRKNKAIVYGARTLLEFPEDTRKHIAEETTRFIF